MEKYLLQYHHRLAGVKEEEEEKEDQVLVVANLTTLMDNLCIGLSICLPVYLLLINTKEKPIENFVFFPYHYICLFYILNY